MGDPLELQVELDGKGRSASVGLIHSIRAILGRMQQRGALANFLTEAAQAATLRDSELYKGIANTLGRWDPGIDFYRNHRLYKNKEGAFEQSCCDVVEDLTYRFNLERIHHEGGLRPYKAMQL